MAVIEDIPIHPFLSPIANAEDFHLAILSGTDDSVQTRIDDHLLADETGKGIYRLELPCYAAVDVHVSA